MVSLKKTHPQKFWLKFLCDLLFYLGAGVCWYEEPQISATRKRFYTFWCVIANVYMFGGMLNQYLAYLRSDLTEKEMLGITQFTLGNSVIAIKILVFYLQKSRILVLFEGFLERYREFSLIELEFTSVRKALKYCILLLFLAYSVMGLAMVEAVVAHLNTGIPIQTEVTIYPRPTTPSILFNILRVLIEVHWYYVVTVMILIDILCLFSLVFLAFKFKRLQTYFQDLRTGFLENPEMKSRRVLEKDFEKNFVNGIKLHKDAIWCARNVQYALGNLYSIQVVESIVLLVMSLIKMVASRHNYTLLLYNFVYTVGIAVVTGAYMMAGGNVTNEAALVPTCIFHSGWELNRLQKRLRTLTVVALINSQVPVLMTAFGIISLSYTNFLLILRHSYSFFAVMY